MTLLQPACIVWRVKPELRAYLSRIGKRGGAKRGPSKRRSREFYAALSLVRKLYPALRKHHMIIHVLLMKDEGTIKFKTKAGQERSSRRIACVDWDENPIAEPLNIELVGEDGAPFAGPPLKPRSEMDLRVNRIQTGDWGFRLVCTPCPPPAPRK